MDIAGELTKSDFWEETIENSGFSITEVERFMDESYESGYNDKDENMRLKVKGIFNANISLTNQIAEEVIAHLKELAICPSSAYLKISPLFNFSIIFTVNLNDYISDRLLKAYDWTNDLEKRVRTPSYNIDLSFMHEDENLNIESLNSDGFRFKHKKLNDK